MFMELLQKRRSIRLYEDRPVEEDKIEALVEAALRSPSSRAIYPWEFVVVTDRRMLADLSRSKEHGASFLAGAPLGIIVCADPGKSDAWIEDASIAAIILQLAAESLGLGSCWIQIRERPHSATVSARDYVAGLLGLPPGVMVEAIVAIGYPAESKRPRSRAKLLFGQVHRERFGRRSG
jgi:nitroreductase